MAMEKDEVESSTDETPAPPRRRERPSSEPVLQPIPGQSIQEPNYQEPPNSPPYNPSPAPTNFGRLPSDPIIVHDQWANPPVSRPINSRPPHTRPLSDPGPPLPPKIPLTPPLEGVETPARSPAVVPPKYALVPKRKPVPSRSSRDSKRTSTGSSNTTFTVPRKPVGSGSSRHVRHTSDQSQLSTNTVSSQGYSSYVHSSSSPRRPVGGSSSRHVRHTSDQSQLPSPTRSVPHTVRSSHSGYVPALPLPEPEQIRNVYEPPRTDTSRLPHHPLLSEHRASEASDFIVVVQRPVDAQPQTQTTVSSTGTNTQEKQRAWICRTLCQRRWPWVAALIFVIGIIVTPTLLELYKVHIIS